jgi:hypothetical protein
MDQLELHYSCENCVEFEQILIEVFVDFAQIHEKFDLAVVEVEDVFAAVHEF